MVAQVNMSDQFEGKRPLWGGSRTAYHASGRRI